MRFPKAARPVFLACAFVLLGVAAAPSGAPAQWSTPAPVPLPPCPALRVELETKLDSATAKVGDIFAFRTIDTVTLPTGLRVAAGTKGFGLVGGAVPAGAHGKSGVLLLESRYIRLPHWRRLDVSIGSGTMESRGVNAGIPSLVTAVPIPGIGLAAGAFNYLSPGKNIDIPVGTRFEVVPVGSIDDLKQHCER
jgi:hypothetical protein